MTVLLLDREAFHLILESQIPLANFGRGLRNLNLAFRETGDQIHEFKQAWVKFIDEYCAATKRIHAEHVGTMTAMGIYNCALYCDLSEDEHTSAPPFE